MRVRCANGVIGMRYDATELGVGQRALTEVLAYDESSGVWVNASRATYCVQHRLPAYVRFWGCNSN